MGNEKRKGKLFPLMIAVAVISVLIALGTTLKQISRSNSNDGLQALNTNDAAGINVKESHDSLDGTNGLSAFISDDSTGGALAISDNRKIEKTASLSVKTKKPDKDTENMIDKCISYGGYAGIKTVEENYATIKLYVPIEKAEKFIQEIKDGYEVVSLSETQEDITKQYVDNDSRLESKKAALKRYQELLEKAETVEDIVSIQEKIDSVQEDIDAYTRTKAAYNLNIDYETITVTLSKQAEKEENGLVMSTLKNGGTTFVIFLINLLFLIPAAFIIAGIGVLIYKVFSKKGKKKTAKTEPAGTETDTVKILHTPAQSAAAQQTDTDSSHNMRDISGLMGEQTVTKSDENHS